MASQPKQHDDGRVLSELGRLLLRYRQHVYGEDGSGGVAGQLAAAASSTWHRLCTTPLAATDEFPASWCRSLFQAHSSLGSALSVRSFMEVQVRQVERCSSGCGSPQGSQLCAGLRRAPSCWYRLRCLGPPRRISARQRATKSRLSTTRCLGKGLSCERSRRRLTPTLCILCLQLDLSVCKPLAPLRPSSRQDILNNGLAVALPQTKPAVQLLPVRAHDLAAPAAAARQQEIMQGVCLAALAVQAPGAGGSVAEVVEAGDDSVIVRRKRDFACLDGHDSSLEPSAHACSPVTASQ